MFLSSFLCRSPSASSRRWRGFKLYVVRYCNFVTLYAVFYAGPFLELVALRWTSTSPSRPTWVSGLSVIFGILPNESDPAGQEIRLHQATAPLDTASVLQGLRDFAVQLCRVWFRGRPLSSSSYSPTPFWDSSAVKPSSARLMSHWNLQTAFPPRANDLW